LHRRSSEHRRLTGLLVVTTVTAVVPIVAAALSAGAHWVPVGDTAILLLRASDALHPSRAPMLGMPTSLSAAAGAPLHHPGPTEFWLFSSVANLGWQAMALQAAVNAAWITTTIAAVRSLAGTSAAIATASCLTAMTASLGGYVLVDPRNPYFATFALTAFLASASAAAASHRRWIPLAVVAGSLAAQAQLSAAVVVAGAAMTAIVAWWRIGRSPRHRRLPSAPALVGIALLVLLWWPPLLDQLTGSGNLSGLLAARATSGAHITAGMVRTSVTNALGTWFGGAEILEIVRPGSPWVITAAAIQVTALAAAAAWAIAKKSAPLVASPVLLGATVTGTIALSRLPDRMSTVLALTNYLWLWPIGAGATALLAALLVRRFPPAIIAAPVVAGAVALLAVIAPIRPPTFSSTERVAAAVPVVSDELDEPGTSLFILSDELERFDLGAGLVRGLRVAGHDVVVPANWGRSFGSDRAVGDGDDVDRVLSVTLGDEAPPEGAEALFTDGEGQAAFVVWVTAGPRTRNR
jgi:hypothetical protein